MDQENERPSITFEEEKWQQSPGDLQTGPPKIIQWVMKGSGGLIKTSKQAQYFLLGVLALALLFGAFFVFSGSQPTPPQADQNRPAGAIE